MTSITKQATKKPGPARTPKEEPIPSSAPRSPLALRSPLGEAGLGVPASVTVTRSKILVVDDEKSIRVTLQAFLQEQGYEVEIAEDAAEAREFLAAGAWDVVVSDIVLPGMSGVELLRSIHSMAPDVQVIMMTGEPTVETASEAVRAGATDYLTKPVPKNALLRSVARALEIKMFIDERRRMEADLRMAKEAADAANQAKSDFLASMSHELRTPLNAVIGFSQMLRDLYFGPLNAKQMEYVDDILCSGKHLLDLINDILDLSKVEAGKMELEKTEFALSDLVESSLLIVREKAAAHGIRLEARIPHDLAGFRVTADERRLKQVMFNLLSNAVKFTPEGGVIRITARLTPNEQAQRTTGGLEPLKTGELAKSELDTRDVGQSAKVGAEQCGEKEHEVSSPADLAHLEQSQTVPTSALLISVTDTGAGIAPEEQEKIFEEFYQVANRVAGKSKGTGLGLPLSRRFVGMHGGKLWVQSAGVGKGSAFRFTVPIVQSEATLLHTIQGRLDPSGKNQDGLSVLLFAMDADALDKAGSVPAGGNAGKVRTVWDAMTRNARERHFETSFFGNEFILVTTQPENTAASTLKPMRSLLKDLLFQIARPATVNFSCGLAVRSVDTAGAKDLLAAARASLVPERERVVSKHIVIVDDEVSVRMALRTELQTQGFGHIDEAAGGVELFSLIGRGIPDLIILDVMMPGMNGYEVIGRLRGRPSTANIPILVLSGHEVHCEEFPEDGSSSGIMVLAKNSGSSALLEHVMYLL